MDLVFGEPIRANIPNPAIILALRADTVIPVNKIKKIKHIAVITLFLRLETFSFPKPHGNSHHKNTAHVCQIQLKYGISHLF